MLCLVLIVLTVLLPQRIDGINECMCDFVSSIPFDVKPFRVDRNCYFTLESMSDFLGAKEKCEENYGQLIIFRSSQEITAVLPKVQCNSTKCPYQAAQSYWINAYSGMYIRKDLRFIQIPKEISKKHIPDMVTDEGIMYSRELEFFSYSTIYYAKPFCKINCLERSSANRLSAFEVGELQEAMTSLTKESYTLNLNVILKYYKFNLKNKKFIYDHNSDVFFHWNRLFVLNIERLLQRKLNASLGVPYWDWLSLKLPDIVLEKTSANNQRNLFRGIPEYFRFGEKFVHRNPKLEEVLQKSKCSLWSDLRMAFEMKDFCHFLQQYSVVISRVLWLVGDGEVFSISNVNYAIYDPLLFLIMSNVDRHFTIWQHMRLREGRSASIKACGPKDITKDPLVPFNTEETWSKLVRENAFPKAANSISHFFYRYRNLEISKYARKLDRVCHVEKRNWYLWVKIEFHQSIPCSAEIRVTIAIPPNNRHRNYSNIYEYKFYIKDRLYLKNKRKFTVWEDVSDLLDKYPHLKDNYRISLNFRYDKHCNRYLMKRKERYSATFITEEEQE